MDASNVGLGAILTQEPSGEQPIFFLSCKLAKAGQNYVVIEREALVIRGAGEYFKYYVWGCQFTVITDHPPLQWLNHINRWLMTWCLALQPYGFTIQYHKGQQHASADFFP